MKSERVYLQPKEIVYRGMLDLMDTQNVREIINDCARESIRFSVMMFDAPWELRFTAVPIGRTRCVTTLGIKTEVDAEDEARDNLRNLADYVLRREYAMLDAMLLIGTPHEAVYDGKGG